MLSILVLILAAAWNNTFSKIQMESHVLGEKTGMLATTCNGKLDLNCDSQTNLKDAGTLLNSLTQPILKKPKPTPTPTISPTPTPTQTPTCGNRICESGENSKTCSTDCGSTGSTPTPTGSPTPVPTPRIAGQPYPGAPACPASAHTENRFHTLWNSNLECHYDHEHGQNPFTYDILRNFPGFNLINLLGNVEVGHTNLSSPMENSHKHGGFKWQVALAHPQGCAGFEDAPNGVNGSIIQYHGFGDYSIEMEARIHTAAALLRICNVNNPTDFGYLYTTQFQDYGQRITPYQGTLINYPNTPNPSYDTGFGPYLSVDCVGDSPTCRTSREQVLNGNLNSATNWTAKRTGRSTTVGSTLLQIFFRARDVYQLFDWSDQTYPFRFVWLCSADGGNTYNPSRCRYNNTTTQVHEIAGEIPAAWDNLEGFDTDARVGRVTAQGFTTKFGALNRNCTSAGDDCHPIKMVNALVGKYGSVIFYTPGKGTNLSEYLPERDIYFCNGTVCSERSYGAVPSGWVGPTN